ncbi:MAG: PqqD family protein [Candidatus Omnitrophica bacterium]|nr:PqqD family protein [Candidatus Omnitrophota bacterium]
MEARKIIRGKRECVFMRDGQNFQLFVVRDNAWQEKKESTDSYNTQDYILAFELSPSAAYIWGMFKDFNTEQAIVDEIVKRHRISNELVKDTVRNFLNILEGYALIDYDMVGSDLDNLSPYQLVLDGDGVSIEDIVLNPNDIKIKPITLQEEAFCQGLSDPHQGYAVPSPPDPLCGDMCLYCC